MKSIVFVGILLVLTVENSEAQKLKKTKYAKQYFLEPNPSLVVVLDKTSWIVNNKTSEDLVLLLRIKSNSSNCSTRKVYQETLLIQKGWRKPIYYSRFCGSGFSAAKYRVKVIAVIPAKSCTKEDLPNDQ
tara:strand:+ start:343 stop:732 length:390 start_codon:yes stop_codon:yes gene_type:complete